MSGLREAQLAAVVLDLRAPLARVGLAASQLARDGSTPAARDLAEGITDAVADLDGGIERTLSLLAPPPKRSRPSIDGRRVLGELRARMEPVLRATGLVWEEDPLGEATSGDPVQVRHAAVALLRAARRLTPRGGRLQLGLRGADDGARLRLELTPASPAERSGADPWEDARLLALANRGVLEVRESNGRADATLWLGPEPPS